MIRAGHSGIAVTFFNLYTRWRIARGFKKFSIRHSLRDYGNPVLLLCNHATWWDGLFIFRLNKVLLKRKFHVMMLEEQLKSRKFLRAAGAFSVNKQKRSVLESIEYASSILDHPENMLLVFPQGKFSCMNACPLVFEKGWFRILSGKTKRVTVLFAVILINYFSDSKPSAVLWLREHAVQENEDAYHIEKAYNEFLKDCISKTAE